MKNAGLLGAIREAFQSKALSFALDAKIVNQVVVAE
tara:strand:+ start:1004 stop:1111 length:108 start_codon:yes stop_codon:yes gene_type:complete